jgi:hypothetical protein
MPGRARRYGLEEIGGEGPQRGRGDTTETGQESVHTGSRPCAADDDHSVAERCGGSGSFAGHRRASKRGLAQGTSERRTIRSVHARRHNADCRYRAERPVSRCGMTRDVMLCSGERAALVWQGRLCRTVVVRCGGTGTRPYASAGIESQSSLQSAGGTAPRPHRGCCRRVNGVGSAVFSPVTATSTGSRRPARGSAWNPTSRLRLGQAGSLTRTEVLGEVRRA